MKWFFGLIFFFKTLAFAGNPDIPSVTWQENIVTVSTVETVFPSPSGLVPARIHVSALSTNAGSVFIGKTGIASDGSTAFLAEVEPGETDVLPVSDESILYHISTAGTEKLSIIYLSGGH